MQDSQGYLLMSGMHRVEALRRMGSGFIPAFVHDYDEPECDIMQIEENLLRAELTVDERKDHLLEHDIILADEDSDRLVELLAKESRAAQELVSEWLCSVIGLDEAVDED